jgi:hypothetical protein
MAIAELDTETIRARPGSRISNKQAREIAPELRAIQTRTGAQLTREEVLEAAKDPASPLHPLFDWDDSSAAHKHRLATAGHIIRSVAYRVRSIGPNVNDYTPMFVHIRDDEADVDDEEGEASPRKSGGYADISRVLNDEKLRETMMRQAARELESWIRRYETLSALAKAVTTARELLETVKAA